MKQKIASELDFRIRLSNSDGDKIKKILIHLCLEKLQVINLANMDFGETKFAINMKNEIFIAKYQKKWCFALGNSNPVAKWKAANQSFTQNSPLS